MLLDLLAQDVSLAANLKDSRALIEVLLDQVEGLKAQVRQQQVAAGQLLTDASSNNADMKDDGGSTIFSCFNTRCCYEL